MDNIYNILSSKNVNIEKMLKAYDKSGRDIIPRDKLEKLIINLNINATNNDIKTLLEFFDKENNELIKISDFILEYNGAKNRNDMDNINNKTNVPNLKLEITKKRNDMDNINMNEN